MRISMKIVTIVVAFAAIVGISTYVEGNEQTDDAAAAVDQAAPAVDHDAYKKYDGFESELDLVSYIIGTSFGGQMKGQFPTADESKVLLGIKDTLAGSELAIPQEDHEAIMMSFQAKMMAQSTGQEAPETEPLKSYEGFTTDDQKVSYVIGNLFSGQMLSQPFKVSAEKLSKGFSDSFGGKELAVPEADQQEIMMAFRETVMDMMEKERSAKMEAAGWKTKLEKPEMMKFDDSKDYIWVLETSEGTVKLKLWPDVAPMHVTSTIFLTNKDFYNDLTFHRVITSFMAQGGCPLGDGSGDPGYEYEGEFKDGVKFDRPYLLAMANAGAGTDGSQFFITFAPTSHLDGKHTIFGEVIEGKDIVDKIEKLGSQSGQTKKEVKIVKATIEENAKAAAK